MEVAVAIAKYVAPWLLVVMGAYVAVNPPSKENKKAIWVWMIAFSFVGALVTGAQVLSDAQQKAEHAAERAREKEERNNLHDQLTGAKHFAFFSARQAKNKNGEYFLIYNGRGATEGVSIGFHEIVDGKQISEKWLSPKDLPNTTIKGHLTIKPGKWRVDFIFKHGDWIEDYELQENGGILREAIKVTRRKTGEVLYLSPLKLVEEK